jgi:hypothetical protein
VDSTSLTVQDRPPSARKIARSTQHAVTSNKQQIEHVLPRSSPCPVIVPGGCGIAAAGLQNLLVVVVDLILNNLAHPHSARYGVRAARPRKRPSASPYSSPCALRLLSPSSSPHIPSPRGTSFTLSAVPASILSSCSPITTSGR